MRLAERREGGREGGEDEKQLQQVHGQGHSNEDPSAADSSQSGGKTIKLDDVTFHQCVNLMRFNSEKTVSFVPSDGSQQHGASGSAKFVIKATGGGAFKYAYLFKEKLGISLDKADEMDCLVAGANFLLKLSGGYLFGLPVGFVADSIGATLGAGAAFLLGRTVCFYPKLLYWNFLLFGNRVFKHFSKFESQHLFKIV
ncbi:hypothetical protein PS2_040088 [Malus domestica]